MEVLQPYYELTGTAAVTLMGLLFVVIALAAEGLGPDDKRMSGTFLTPTAVHLGVVFLIALLALSPEGDRLILPFGLIAVIGVVYSLVIALKAASTDDAVGALFHGVIPCVCYVGILTAAWLSMTSARQAHLVLRAVSALLLVVGMRNTWAVAFEVIRRK